MRVEQERNQKRREERKIYISRENTAQVKQNEKNKGKDEYI